MSERNIKLILEYDGTNYAGWQYQKNAITIQQTVEEAVESLTGAHSSVLAAGRTDRGVHAIGQVVSFKTKSKIPIERWPAAMNAVLPPDIRVKSSQNMPIAFHARFDAKGKRYKYFIWNASYASALLRNRTLHISTLLNVSAMQEASRYLIGKHDFSSFQASGSAVRDAVREVWSTDVGRSGDIVSFSISGDGFLYNMVRIMVGTLIDVGIGKITADDMQAILDAHDRRKAGKTVAPQGLYLMEVYY